MKKCVNGSDPSACLAANSNGEGRDSLTGRVLRDVELRREGMNKSPIAACM
jgi:hypothetical protein